MKYKNCTGARTEIIKHVLELIPQKAPFRFIDTILDISDTSITGVYRFKKDEYFYEGHFPGKPITPGVILIETMAQTGVVALGISHLLQHGKSFQELKQITTLFAYAEHIEFRDIVYPDETITIHGEMVYFRRGNIKTKVRIKRENEETICTGVLTGSGVKLNGK